MSLAYLQVESSPTHPDDIWALKWTAANQLASGSADGHLRIFDAGEPSSAVYDIHSHPLAITSLSVSEDGRRGLAASLDGTLAMVDLREGRLLGKLDSGREKIQQGEHELPAYACSLHPQSSAYAWSGRSSKIVIKSIPSESLLDTAEENGDEQTNGESSKAVGKGPLGEGEGKVINTERGRFGMDIKFSPDGRQIAVSSESGNVSVIDTESQSVVAKYQSHAMAVRSISWSQDSQSLFSGSDDHRIVLHDVRAGSSSTTESKGEGAVAIFQGHLSWVLSVAASPDGRLLGSAGADKQVKLWDIAQRTSVFTSTTNAPVWSFDWQPSNVTIGSLGVGKQFAVAGDEKSVLMYRAAGTA